VPDPQFEGQTKTKLGNGEVEGIVASIVNEQLGTFSRRTRVARASSRRACWRRAPARRRARRAT
jgi:DNA gyrase subunit B